MSAQKRNEYFHVMAKPVGSACNLACAYCYYLDKGRVLRGDAPPGRMSDSLLEEFIRQYVAANRSAPEISFAWQGGEPTLMGLDFFRRVVELQRRYGPPGVAITNSIQTNGTLIDDEWARFLAANKFLVGVSIDGPADLHNTNRLDRAGQPSFARTLAGLRLLREHGAEFNALVVVSRANSARPVDVYRFLRDEARVQFIQFIPCVERTDFVTVAPGYWPADSLPTIGSPAARPGNPDSAVTPWSVDAEEFGSFLCAVFDEWLAGDVGRIFVQTFDVALGQWMGLGSSLCVFAPTCGRALAMEPDGSLFACDHYVYPEYRLGGIEQTNLVELAGSERQRQFGLDKSDKLPRYCRECPVRFACNGECPKNRFCRTPDGEPGLNYLCPGLRRFFTHIDPWMKLMAAELKAGRPAAGVMKNFGSRISDFGLKGGGSVPQSAIRDPKSEMNRSNSRPKHDGPPSPNAPCPCGSGRKFKKCCGRK